MSRVTFHKPMEGGLGLGAGDPPEGETFPIIAKLVDGGCAFHPSVLGPRAGRAAPCCATPRADPTMCCAVGCGVGTVGTVLRARARPGRPHVVTGGGRAHEHCAQLRHPAVRANVAPRQARASTWTRRWWPWVTVF